MNKTILHIALAATAVIPALAVPALAQSDARGIYVDGAKPGMKFNVMLERDGRTTSVPATATFRSGDRMKFQFDVNKDSYVYVLHRTVDGDASHVDRYAGSRGIEIIRDDDRRDKKTNSYDLLFPNAQAGRNNLIKAHAATSVPSASSQYFRMDENPGMEKLIIIASQRPIKIEDYFDISSGKIREGSARHDDKGGRRDDTDDDVLSQLTRSLMDYSGNSIVDTSTKGIDVVDGYAGSKDPAKPIVVTVDLRHAK